jgi:hypothetical protein
MMSTINTNEQNIIRTDQVDGGETLDLAEPPTAASVDHVHKSACAKRLASFHTTNRWCGIGWIQSTYATYASEPGFSEETITTQFLPASWIRILRGIAILQNRRNYNRWTYTPTPFCVIPSHSPVFAACEAGDVEEVERLFSTGTATVYDTNENGWTLLHVSVNTQIFAQELRFYSSQQHICARSYVKS